MSSSDKSFKESSVFGVLITSPGNGIVLKISLSTIGTGEGALVSGTEEIESLDETITGTCVVTCEAGGS